MLIFNAHPDDAEFAMGGVLLKLAREHDVVNVILTRGEAGTHGTPAEREREAHEAGRRGGYRVRILDYKDTQIEDTTSTVQDIARIIREEKPRLIFAPYHTNNRSHLDGRAHPDHTALGNIVRKAARIAKFTNAPIKGDAHQTDGIIYYMLPIHTKPSFTIDVSDVIDELPNLWKAHASQTKLRDGAIIDHLLNWRRQMGSESRLAYAESFITEETPVLSTSAIPNMFRRG